jgi:hypothetical protein
MDYVEEKEFTLRLQVRRVFPEGYEGEADGYAWWEEFPAGEIVRAAHEIAARAGFSARPANRGRPTDEEVTLVLERTDP